ncbi:MAG: pantetheine-phosphate adenylyltransferase [Muribaculaceae bacterium]|nr:pantetheine-phosphate adenylyltransferase [Muribaculaceae bacterium]
MKTSQCTDGSGARRVALFPGSFDPFTRGHESIVRRALPLFDELIIAVGVNPTKRAFMDAETRMRFIREVMADEPRVRVISYEGLTVDIARECGARFLLRGVRMIQDFENEMHMAEVNRQLSGIETVLLYTLPEDSHISSSIVRELAGHGCDITSYLPASAPAHLLPEAQQQAPSSTNP